ncbi:MAG: bifunctional nuclease family protein [Massilibacteroides sp.]|nr:bifunctional nuclease family protein [Massilibacteroides sp.]MDD3061210.1 bifunctional nuclease family protein [Massilibacteroides sp.]MDD4115579.1 bifunctional nuclease family protein [Massilibacteroides sp.]MDD4661104.1 bifunctional nuclease family protein [Massilibacteroides sp.]
MNTRIKLRVQGLTNSQVQSGAYALVLSEESGVRRIPIIVGTTEAQSIAIALEEITPPRPLTHDLFTHLMQTLDIKLVEVFIYKFVEGVFYSELVINSGSKLFRIDSRTSDAIAIALRMKSDIYTTETIVRECGVVLEEDADKKNLSSEEKEQRLAPTDLKDEEQMKQWLSVIPSEELQERLDEAIASENYEYAKIYRDEQDRRDREDPKI